MAANPGFYVDQTITALTSSFVAFQFSCMAGYLSIWNDDAAGGANKVQWSYDGVTVHGAVSAQQHVEIQDSKMGAIYLRFLTGAPSYKVIARAS